MCERRVVIGVGNRWRGDDAVGPLVLDALARRRHDGDPAAAGVVLVELDGEPTRLLDAWAGAAVTVVVDAASCDAPAGTVGVIVVGDEPVDEPGADSLPEAPRTGASSHAAGLSEAVALGRALDRLPERLVVVTVAATGFELGASPSASVVTAVEPAAQVVLDQLSKRQGPVTS